MAELFENMEKMDVQAERKNTEEQRQRAEAAEQKTKNAEQKAERGISLLLKVYQQSGMTSDSALQMLITELGLEMSDAKEKIKRYWNHG